MEQIHSQSDEILATALRNLDAAKALATQLRLEFGNVQASNTFEERVRALNLITAIYLRTVEDFNAACRVRAIAR